MQATAYIRVRSDRLLEVVLDLGSTRRPLLDDVATQLSRLKATKGEGGLTVSERAGRVVVTDSSNTHTPARLLEKATGAAGCKGYTVRVVRPPVSLVYVGRGTANCMAAVARFSNAPDADRFHAFVQGASRTWRSSSLKITMPNGQAVALVEEGSDPNAHDMLSRIKDLVNRFGFEARTVVPPRS